MKYSSEKNVQLMVALLKAHGIKKVIASPGTTNITFIGSLMHDPFFEIYSSVDERSAAYIACGMAEESGEPVVISCTGATASRNYFSGLTEAYYRKLPILAVTSTREECKIGHLIDQQIDRTQQPKDTVLCSEHLQIIKDDEDLWDCTIKANRAILALKHNGGGPAHINLPTSYSGDFSVEKLPECRKISRYYAYNSLPEIGNRDIAIFIGTHRQMTQTETDAIDAFCELHNAVVFVDTCSGYHGKYSIIPSVNHKNTETDLLVHIGEVSCLAYSIKPREVWRVSEDGELRDTFRKLTNVFCMPEKVFFDSYNKRVSSKNTSKYDRLKAFEKKTYENIRDVPFSNGWVALYLHDKLPKNCVVHLGIVSTFFAWSRFCFDRSINVNCNQGGFGIDGNLSSILGASLVHPDKLYFCFLGDLAFFYDMNVLGNRHFGRNIRILLVNNGKGVIFRKPGNIGSLFGEEADLFLSAGGHYGNKSPQVVKNYVESFGFEYMSAYNKEELAQNSERFLVSNITDRPMLLEVFVDTDNEIAGDYIIKDMSGIKGVVRNILGEKIVDTVKKYVKPVKKGAMHVDCGRNK